MYRETNVTRFIWRYRNFSWCIWIICILEFVVVPCNFVRPWKWKQINQGSDAYWQVSHRIGWLSGLNLLYHYSCNAGTDTREMNSFKRLYKIRLRKILGQHSPHQIDQPIRTWYGNHAVLKTRDSAKTPAPSTAECLEWPALV